MEPPFPQLFTIKRPPPLPRMGAKCGRRGDATEHVAIEAKRGAHSSVRDHAFDTDGHAGAVANDIGARATNAESVFCQHAWDLALLTGATAVLQLCRGQCCDPRFDEVYKAFVQHGYVASPIKSLMADHMYLACRTLGISTAQLALHISIRRATSIVLEFCWSCWILVVGKSLLQSSPARGSL